MLKLHAVIRQRQFHMDMTAALVRFLRRTPLQNIPGPEPVSWWKGNLGYLYDRHGWSFLDRLDTYSGVARVDGLFGAKLLYVFDPAALQHIVTKEQTSFDPAAWFTESLKMTFGPGLLSAYGEQHRKQRKMLNPVFSIAHMRDMTPIFYEIAHKLRDAISAEIEDGARELNILDWMGRTALELIGQGGLGYSFDSLTKDAINPFGDAIKSFVPAIFTTFGYLRFLTPYVAFIQYISFRRVLLDRVPWAGFQNFLKIVDKLNYMSTSVYEGKRTALAAGDAAVTEQVGRGKDIMSILLKANMSASQDDQLGEADLIGQMVTLLFAATDTTSGALSQILQLLAEHQDVQDKLRDEIRAAKQGDFIGYDDLHTLPFMDAICRETLRLYPPVSFVYRQANQTTSLPLSQPIRGNDGSMLNEITVPKGTMTVVGVRSCNRNKALWGEDALEWKPERWLSSLPDAVINARIPGVYANLMTFFGGSRSCIGFKFSQLEMKIVLSVLIDSFNFHIPEDKGAKIVWNLAGVKFPTVGKDSLKPAFPMIVERLAKA
ncbi:cytochrome P450-dit2 [Steccherinum ochraceum]|uniref:Cytochrome P450-dit2 n=1 Tax=Steccherinum ochraceum TaxID=92696 RepID=A0A4R0RCC6_9APHY|nr:cytochrome P450-dit2 [Steccherinum ochraceum]